MSERDDTIERLRRATARRPPIAEAFLELGGRLGAAGRADEGAAVLEEGLALLPGSVPLRIGLGYLRLRQGDRPAARALFAAAHAADPARHDALVALAMVVSLDGDHAAAADLYRRALAVRPDDPVTRLNLARGLLELGQTGAGEAALRDAVRGAPQLLRAAIAALADPPRGRLFLRPSAAAAYLRA
jgi:tetratricopeptide (TPR) repeat protein